MNNPIHILLVEDVPEDRDLLMEYLEQTGKSFQVQTADSLDQALQISRNHHFDLVLLDLGLPDSTGLDTLRRFRANAVSLPVIVLTDIDDEETGIQAIRIGAQDYLDKGRVNKNGLLRSVRHAIERQRLFVTLDHTQRLLRAIRKINRLIVKEKDPGELIRKACAYLIEQSGYFGAWIILSDEKEQMQGHAEAGLGEHFNRLLETVQKGELPNCLQQTFTVSDPVLFDQPGQSCPACPLKDLRPDKACLAAPLLHGDKRFGVLTVSFSRQTGPYDEETQLIHEVSRDIAFALEGLEAQEERRKAEKALVESEFRYRELFDGIRDAILVADKDRNIINCNTAFTTLFGYTPDEILGRKTSCVYHDMEEFEKMGEEIRQNIDTPSFLFTIQYRKKSGMAFPGETSVFYLKDSENHVKGMIGLTRDVSERIEHEQEKKQLENKYLQAQKMESLGTLAGGIAHDFNNILSAILGYSQLALNNAAAGEDINNDLKEIHRAGLRASDLVSQILTFSRKSEKKLMPLKAAPVIKEAVKLLQSTIPSYIEIESIVRNPKLKIMQDPTQLHQIVMNLCTNASHAMEKDGGVLTVEATEETITEADADQFSGLQAGEHLKIRVRDTGHGIPNDIRDSIFDPYFTTKDPKEGTGLGLSVVHGLVKESGGDIQVQSDPGRGTTFFIRFPGIPEREKAEEETKADKKPGGDETILFVDDEPSLTRLAARHLTNFGYRVTTETESDKALERIKKNPGDFDLLITDMAMPKLTGDMLLDEVRKINPDLPVILCTGFTKRLTPEQARERGFQGVIDKPFSQTLLAGTVREVLDEANQNKKE
ncbi:MAG: response regulator [Desulfarculaceae bacterium]|nr:response regulator [Desulfarculaceae bacterium]